MQDIHAIDGAGGGGRLFAGGSGGGAGDRKLRPHHNQNHHHPQAALKCPRCDSLNTKFCYYNNYNLSQPRHFCKGCRRYWTKGGVLRNVPVGGGCRKTKRSKTKQTVSSDVAPAAGERNSNSQSHSSSESSSLTATTTAAKKTATAGSSGEVASATATATANCSNSASNLLNFPDSGFFLPQMNANANNTFDQNQPLIDPSVTSEGQLFTEIGSFTSLMTSSNDQAMLGFNNMAAGISAYRLQQDQRGPVLDDQSSNQMVGTSTTVAGDELKMEQINCGFLDQTAQIGFFGLEQNRISNSGLPGLDWQMNGGGEGEQGLFDFTGTVDQAYWGQNQWVDNDQSLNFPPLV